MMKSVFITGGTSGIGLALAQAYLKQGWFVGVCGRDKEKFETHFTEENKSSLVFYQLDVSDRRSLKEAIHAFSLKNSLDILIANAGISYPIKSKIPDFERTYEMVNVNLLGVMYAFEAAMEVMIPKRRGQLVAISSLAGFNGLPGVSGYSATKSAVIKFCESLSLDLKDVGLDVTCICPGYIDTPLTKLNHHRMPFLMTLEVAVQKIIKSIEKKKMLVLFPFRLSIIVRLLSLIPRPCYRYLMKMGPLHDGRNKEIL